MAHHHWWCAVSLYPHLFFKSPADGDIMAITAQNAQNVLSRSECLFDRAAVNTALDAMAERIAADLSEENPLVLCLMTGGLVPTSELLLRLYFPLELDYIHATRYGENTYGGTQLNWLAKPRTSLEDRNVLIVDDILDEGQTLASVIGYCKEQKAKSVRSAVLVEKDHDRKSGIDKADYTGLIVPDRYVFGFGMDYKGFLRNVPGIYAAQKEDE
jgi:hypoxanthine phosphoribosyltransferase